MYLIASSFPIMNCCYFIAHSELCSAAPPMNMSMVLLAAV